MSTVSGPTATPDATVAEGARPRWKRDVAIFLSGQTVSLFGSMLVQYAVFWHLTLTTKSGLVMAIAAIVGFLPQAFVSVFGGVWADRLNRKRLIIAADAGIAVSTLLLALIMLSGFDELWLIFVVLGIRSVGAGIQMPAVSALIPQIVPSEHLMRVNGVYGSIQSAMALLAPAAAGAIYAFASLTAIFFVDVVTAVIGIALLAALAVPTLRAADERPGYFTDLRDGVRYVAGNRTVRWLLTLFAVVFLLAVAPSNLTPLMLVRSFGDEVWMLTVLEICFSVGMIAGGIVIAAWGGMKNRIVMLAGASLLFGVLAIALGLSPNVWIFFGFMAIVGLAVPFFSTPSFTLLQETVEPERHGRVFGFVGIVMALAMPIGMSVLGPLADVIAVETLLVATGIVLFVAVTAAFLLPAGREALRTGGRREAPSDADATAEVGEGERPEDPEPAPAVGAETGPLV